MCGYSVALCVAVQLQNSTTDPRTCSGENKRSQSAESSEPGCLVVSDTISSPSHWLRVVVGTIVAPSPPQDHFACVYCIPAASPASPSPRHTPCVVAARLCGQSSRPNHFSRAIMSGPGDQLPPHGPASQPRQPVQTSAASDPSMEGGGQWHEPPYDPAAPPLDASARGGAPEQDASAGDQQRQPDEGVDFVATKDRVPLFSWGSGSAPSLPSVESSFREVDMSVSPDGLGPCRHRRCWGDKIRLPEPTP